ncbi:protein tyrosine phosphatase [Sulfobacillus sp. hq2]|uniref:arsenate reductase/protein-tyrosine-phosphatase family protein n=1 Tax=Sulfobacillus TaxID=28033 RepID=UPI000CD03FBC|nr:protein tyrosine phosphatase [Sulfobacillus sp. hq2]POB09762.1 protein tyrosine phosphatase [Sulfobacillus sp. hq2]
MPKTQRNILFVCTGNTCRSAMAEALWRAMDIECWPASSAGVAAWPGQAAEEFAQEAVKPYGGDLSRHRSRDVSNLDEDYYLILTMTTSQAQTVRRLRPKWADKTFVLPQFLGEGGEITDPLGTNQVYYDSLAWRLYRLLARLKEKLGQDYCAKAETGE